MLHEVAPVKARKPQEAAPTPAPGTPPPPTRDPGRATGALLGAALGDAVALQVEGDSIFTIEDRHPNGVDYPYKGAFRGYEPNDWTDATDTTVLVLRTLTAYAYNKTDKPAQDFAQRLAAWTKNGYPELSDTIGRYPDNVTQRVVSLTGFTTDPVGTAQSLKPPKVENGGLIRTLGCAFTEDPSAWAQIFCETTHSDPRCVVSAQFFSMLVNTLAYSDDICMAAALPAIRIAHDALPPRYRAEFLNRLTRTVRLAELELEERENRTYTFRTMGCAFWALRQVVRTPPSKRDADFFKNTIRLAAGQGGDATSNCAIVGAVLGAVLGEARLPADWLAAMPHRKWLDKEIAAFLN